MIQCPECNGEKEIRIAFPHNRDKPTLSCMQCKGTGEVPEEMIQWMENGEILKDKRISKRMTLRKATKQLGGLDLIMKFSEMERGVIEPDMSIYDNLKEE